MNRSDDHEVVGQMETFDAEIRMTLAKLPPHPLFEALGSIGVTKDRPALSEKPADLDQGACIRGCASERRQVGDDDVASLHQRNVLLVNGPPDIQRLGGRLDILIERWERAQPEALAYLHLPCGVRDRVWKKHIRSRQIGCCCHDTSHQIGSVRTNRRSSMMWPNRT